MAEEDLKVLLLRSDPIHVKVVRVVDRFGRVRPAKGTDRLGCCSNDRGVPLAGGAARRCAP
eukprot:6307302-Alexandrium_andersonii.AAC.1